MICHDGYNYFTNVHYDLSFDGHKFLFYIMMCHHAYKYILHYDDS